MDTFTCAMCHGTFNRTRPKAEADREAAAIWGKHPDDWPDGQAVEVCDPCYQKVDPMKHPVERERSRPSIEEIKH